MYVLQYPSSKGCPAYLVDPLAIGIRDRGVTEPWARTTYKASGFPTKGAALTARDSLIQAQRFIAPEYNWGLLNRLLKGVPVKVKEIPPSIKVVPYVKV